MKMSTAVWLKINLGAYCMDLCGSCAKYAVSNL